MKRSQWTAICALTLLLLWAMPIGAFDIGVTGITYSGNYLYEGLADLSLTPFPFLDLHGGYKVIRLHLDRNDFYLNSEFTGPYVALTVSF